MSTYTPEPNHHSSQLQIKYSQNLKSVKSLPIVLFNKVKQTAEKLYWVLDANEILKNHSLCA